MVGLSRIKREREREREGKRESRQCPLPKTPVNGNNGVRKAIPKHL